MATAFSAPAIKPTEPIAAQLACFVSGLRYEDLPPHTIDGAKRLVLDQLACELAGSTMPWMRPALELVRLSAGARAESVVVNSDLKCLAADAAFINASYGQACELDDATYGSAGHIGTAAVPPALAVAQREGTNGRQLLLAIIAGYEVMYRLMAGVRPYHRTRGFHSQSIGGPFAAAAAAGKILGLDAEQLTHALAIAGSHACGPLEFDQSGGEVKRIHAGIAARGGVQSALLAGLGLTGPATIIEGKRGFCQVFADKSDTSRITAGLGKVLNITNAWFKIYPVVGGIQTSIAAMSRLVAEHDIKARDVKAVRIGLTESALLHCAAITRPSDVIGAQFSLAFSVALAIVRRSNELGCYTDAANWVDPEINALMQRVEAHADVAAVGERDFMASVAIELTDGRTLETVEVYPLGSPRKPASSEQLDAKARSLAGTVLGPERTERLIETVRHLEEVADVSAIGTLLAADEADVRGPTISTAV